MLISVITINLNNQNGLEKTIKSVANQGNKDLYEYLVIDGLSKDNSVEIINKYKSIIDKIVVENDSGIFDAMNKGIDHATGDYIYFLNSGDTFVSNNTLDKVAKEIVKHRKSIYCGDVDVLLDGQFYKKANVYPWLPHQGAFVSRNLHNEYKFDTNLKIFGDLDLWTRLKKDNKLIVEKLDFSIAAMEMDGVGNNPLFFKRRLKDKKVYNRKHNIGSHVMALLYIDNYIGYSIFKLFGKNAYWKKYIKLRMKIKRLISGR